jgi:hypothetical protein
LLLISGLHNEIVKALLEVPFGFTQELQLYNVSQVGDGVGLVRELGERFVANEDAFQRIQVQVPRVIAKLEALHFLSQTFEPD